MLGAVEEHLWSQSCPVLGMDFGVGGMTTQTQKVSGEQGEPYRCSLAFLDQHQSFCNIIKAVRTNVNVGKCGAGDV